MANKNIASKTIPPKSEGTLLVDHVDETNSKKLGIAEKSRELTSIADQIAQDKLYHKRYLIDEVRKKYPYKVHLWHVEKMYPMAKGGRLHVDEPQREWEIKECEEKMTVYKEMGIRYVYIKPHATMMDALELAGLDV